MAAIRRQCVCRNACGGSRMEAWGRLKYSRLTGSRKIATITQAALCIARTPLGIGSLEPVRIEPPRVSHSLSGRRLPGMAKSGGPTVGLDIGSSLIKVAELVPGRNGVTVRAMGMAPTPVGA